MPQPNIVYIHSHDTGRYIQPYGHSVEMPNYQRLAGEGVLFRQAFCGGPTCSPSRAALLTGQWAHCSGMLGLAHRGFNLKDPTQHIATVLRETGYRTVLAGLQHLTDGSPETLGYTDIIGKPGNAEIRAADFLDARPAEPFFLDVGFTETHRRGNHFHPEGRKGDDGRYTVSPAPLPDTPEVRSDMSDYWASARVLDTKVGVVLEALDRNGLAEDTLIVSTTDHGIAFPRMKCSLTDHGIGVLLILRYPAGWGGGCATDALVSHIDIFPTICELAGIPTPEWTQGKSLLPLLRGETDTHHEQIFSEVTYHAAYEPQRAVRTRRYKYIRRYDSRSSPVLSNCDDSPSKSYLMAHGWQTMAPAREQLYDLTFDPNESQNLLTDPAYTETLNEMRGRLEKWMFDTDDPLLHGPVPPPPGARYNDPDATSPTETTLG